jgi:P-type E1-E2 ATPase
MVGNGINDVPALTFTYVGIAMEKIGSHTAIEAVDAVLLNDYISSISWLIKHTKKTPHCKREYLPCSICNRC